MGYDDIHSAADLVNKMTAQFEAENMETAEAFVVVVTCTEGGRLMTWVHGPVEDGVEALRQAMEHEAELNEGLAPGDDPYRAVVLPMTRLK